MKSLTFNKISRGLCTSLWLASSVSFVPLMAIADDMKMEVKTDSTQMDKISTMPSMKSDSMSSMRMQGGKPPKDARDPNEHSGGFEYRGMKGWEETDEITFGKTIIDQLEYRNNDGSDTLRWDIQGWNGTDYKKFWYKFEGENDTSSSTGDLEIQGLYSKTIAPFWDFQVGMRYDREYGSGTSEDRFFGVVGFQGLAPYWFEMEPSLYISQDGDVSARVVSTYDLLFTQKLILQPRMEVNLAASNVPEFGIGKGLNDVELGLRLRYEIRREFAPYVGVSWNKQLGDTADIARTNGDNVENAAVVAGVRLWF